MGLGLNTKQGCRLTDLVDPTVEIFWLPIFKFLIKSKYWMCLYINCLHNKSPEQSHRGMTIVKWKVMKTANIIFLPERQLQHKSHIFTLGFSSRLVTMLFSVSSNLFLSSSFSAAATSLGIGVIYKQTISYEQFGQEDVRDYLPWRDI